MSRESDLVRVLPDLAIDGVTSYEIDDRLDVDEVLDRDFQSTYGLLLDSTIAVKGLCQRRTQKADGVLYYDQPGSFRCGLQLDAGDGSGPLLGPMVVSCANEVCRGTGALRQEPVITEMTPAKFVVTAAVERLTGLYEHYVRFQQ